MTGRTTAVRARATTISWIPSELVDGILRRGFDVGLSHYDEPPPSRLTAGDLERLCADDRFRFANLLTAHGESDGARVTRAAYGEDADLVIGVTRVRLARWSLSFRASRLTSLRREPEHLRDGSVRLVQTVGGRTGAPMPRPVPHRGFAQWSAPVVWTTLGLTLHPDGASTAELLGASAFPRHWVYDGGGSLVGRSGVTDLHGWLDHAFGERTPWGDQDSPTVLAEASSDLEQQLSADIMGGARPQIRRLGPGAVLTRQGEPGTELYLVLDGLLDVSVDDAVVARIGPGAVVGERAVLEGGLRTATLTADTAVVVAVADRSTIDRDRLAALATGHHREP